MFIVWSTRQNARCNIKILWSPRKTGEVGIIILQKANGNSDRQHQKVTENSEPRL